MVTGAAGVPFASARAPDAGRVRPAQPAAPLRMRGFLLLNDQKQFFQLTSQALQCWLAVDANGEPQGACEGSMAISSIKSVYSSTASGDTKFTLEADEFSWHLRG